MYNVGYRDWDLHMKKWIWRLFWAVIGIYLATALFLVPYLIRTKVPDIVHDLTGGTLSIEKVSFNPLVLNLVVQGVRFDTPEGDPLLALQRIDINLDVVHLLYGKLSIEHFGIYSPEL